MKIYRLNEKLRSNPKKVILRFFDVGEKRTKRIIDEIKSLSEEKVTNIISEIRNDFTKRHKNFDTKIFNNYKMVEHLTGPGLNENQKYLAGAFLSNEYSVEAAALFNPSLVLHPDQTLLKPGMARIVLSLRATGEGHVSSIEFRTGIIDEQNNLFLDPPSSLSELPDKFGNEKFSKAEIKAKGIFGVLDSNITNGLPEIINEEDFVNVANALGEKDKREAEILFDYMDSNYSLKFNKESAFNERVIFPSSKSESAGMEDLRLVRFIEDNGVIKYYGTYTAYNGRTFRVQLLETINFEEFKISTLHGSSIVDKGMALFPRKINGKYYMISRQGGENLSIMKSDNLYRWDSHILLKEPFHEWEKVQLGNCGSPIETEKGWLLITHAVGPMRKYVISACLLDSENPEKVIASLPVPLISPEENERDGYVPNVVYSCGSINHNGELFIPYAMSDYITGFARVNMDELLSNMN